MDKIDIERGDYMGRLKMSLQEINNIVLKINKNIVSGMSLNEALIKNNVSIGQYNYWCKRLINETCTNSSSLKKISHIVIRKN